MVSSSVQLDPFFLSKTSELKPEQITSCYCLNSFHKILKNIFFKLGFLVAKNPALFIVIPFLVSLLGATGCLQPVKYERDPETLFSPTNGHARFEKNLVEKLFPMNYSFTFDPSRMTKISTFAKLLLSAKDNQTMFRRTIWDDVMKVDAMVLNLTIEWEDSTFNYEDVCAKWNFKCIENSVLKLDGIMDEIEDGTTSVNYPIMLFPLILPLDYGGVEANETEGVIVSVNSISLTYYLKESTASEKSRSQLFEQRILRLLKEVQLGGVNVVGYLSTTMEQELDRNTLYIVNYILPTAIVITLATAICMYDSDWVRSKMQMGLIGSLTVVLAIGSSFGFLMYCQVPFIGINLAAPFLLFGIGLDDMFVLLSAWSRTNRKDDVPQRLAETYSEAAVSITITSVTNMLSFFIGICTPFLSVQIFCIYTGLSILAAYVLYLTFFGGCLAMAGYPEKQQRHAVTCRIVKAKSKADYLGISYLICCAGEMDNNNTNDSKDSKPHLLMTFFKEYFARILNFAATKVLIIFGFVLYLAGAIYGCQQIKEGLEYRNLALDESYMSDYYEVHDAMFRVFPYRIQVIINENITYSDPETRKRILELHEAFENLTCVAPALYTESWIRRFIKFLDRHPHFRDEIKDEVSFIKILKENFFTPKSPEFLDVMFNEDETQIIGSRFIIQSYEVGAGNGEKEMMEAVRRVAQEAPFRVETYHPAFIIFDQFVTVKSLTIQTIILVAVVMLVVSFILIPNPLCTLWVTFSIVSIMVGVVGYMSLWGVSLDSIAMINLIMCVGFSVDFSAHISYSYLTSRGTSSKERVEECLFNLGMPVIQSAVTTVAGVFVFIVSPSYVFRTFFKVIFLVIVFGTAHALLLLPVMLSLLGPGSCRKESVQQQEINDLKLCFDAEINEKTSSEQKMKSQLSIISIDGLNNSAFTNEEENI